MILVVKIADDLCIVSVSLSSLVSQFLSCCCTILGPISRTCTLLVTSLLLIKNSLQITRLNFSKDLVRVVEVVDKLVLQCRDKI